LILRHPRYANAEIHEIQAERAIRRLLRLGLLEEREGKIKRKVNTSIRIGSEMKSKAIRAFHRSMIERAISAIELQPMELRELRGTTVSIRSADYHKFQALLREFHEKVTRLAAKGDGDETYQMNTQFFRLTKPGSFQ